MISSFSVIIIIHLFSYPFAPFLTFLLAHTSEDGFVSASPKSCQFSPPTVSHIHMSLPPQLPCPQLRPLATHASVIALSLLLLAATTCPQLSTRSIFCQKQ